MGEAVRRFVARAPRYVLQPEDAEILFFAPQDRVGVKYPTRILNISATGIAFLVYRSTAPRIGDLIKIEFSVPDGGQVAWWAHVVRLSEYNPKDWWRKTKDYSSTEVFVAVEFKDLPEGFRKEIQDGIWKRYKKLIAKTKQERRQRFYDFLKAHYINVLLFMACALIAVAALYWFSSLEPLFDVKNGSIYRELWKGLDF